MVTLSGLFLLQLLQRSSAATGAQLQPRQAATIPDYVNTYAPLLHLDENETYLPSDIRAHLDHTFPALNLTAIPNAPSPLTLSTLDQLNALGNCTPANPSPCPLYLTAKDNITTNPSWLNGVAPDPTTHATPNATSCAIILTDHGDGLLDAFYMYFYAFNQGLPVNGQVLGNHVGDWEHTMVRFANGTPVAVWLSQHDSGEAYTYRTLTKTGTGTGLRPLLYIARGTHAHYAVSGTHSRTIATVVVNDTTSAGPLWDPVLSAYYYAYHPSSSSSANGTFSSSFANGTFLPLADTTFPTAWLSFLGHWGDARYPDSDARQVDFLNLGVAWRYEGGPTGPWDKGLVRRGVCPDGDGKECTTLSALPVVSGASGSGSGTVSGAGATGTGSVVGGVETGTGTGTGTGMGTAVATKMGSAGTRMRTRSVGWGWVLEAVVGVVWMGVVGIGML